MHLRVLRVSILVFSMFVLLPAGALGMDCPLESLQETLPTPVWQPPVVNVSVAVTTDAAPRPGFMYTYHVILRNKGNTIISAEIDFVKDAKLDAPVSIPDDSSFNGNTLAIPFEDLTPWEVREYNISFLVPMLPEVEVGEQLTAFASVGLENDAEMSNNVFQKKEAIVNSYDPNDLTEAHGEKIELAGFGPNDLLYYTVRFENTGTSTTSFIIIEDLLDNQLDPSSVALVSSSHYLTMGRTDNKVRFLFPDIGLPPSVPNTMIGRGQVTFSVRPYPGIQVGDIIPNQAHIFFDFNPSIPTNVFETEFVATLSTDAPEMAGFRAFPNPVRDNLMVVGLPSAGVFTLFSLSGQQLLTRATYDQTASIDVSFLPAGNYLLRWEGENSRRAVMITKP